MSFRALVWTMRGGTGTAQASTPLIALAMAALLGVLLLWAVSPAQAEEVSGKAGPDSALLVLEKVVDSGAAPVTELNLAKEAGRGGIGSLSATAFAQVNSVTLWDEYLPKRGSSGTGLVGSTSNYTSFYRSQ